MRRLKRLITKAVLALPGEMCRSRTHYVWAGIPMLWIESYDLLPRPMIEEWRDVMRRVDL